LTDRENDGRGETDEARPEQHRERVGGADDAAQIAAVDAIGEQALAAGEIETDEGRRDHQDHRHGGVPPAPRGVVVGRQPGALVIGQRLRRRGHELPGPGAPLGGEHRPPVAPRHRHREGDGETEDRIERERDGAEEDAERVEVRPDLLEGVADQRDLIADPRRDQGDAGHRRRRRVHQIGELLATDVVAVGHRPHGVADDEGVGVVVEEDRHPHRPAHDLGAARGGREGCEGLDDPVGAAAAAHDPDHAAEQDRKQDDAHLVGIGERVAGIGVDDPKKAGPGVAVGEHCGAEPDTDEERQHDVAVGQGERDGDQRRQQRPPGLGRVLRRRRNEQEGPDSDDDQDGFEPGRHPGRVARDAGSEDSATMNPCPPTTTRP